VGDNANVVPNSLLVIIFNIYYLMHDLELQNYQNIDKNEKNLQTTETQALNIPDLRLHYILHQFGYDYISDKNLFNKYNLKWFYRNL
jgi:hypothetical protein